MTSDTTFPARDGYRLAATEFVPDGPLQAAVVMNSATAVPRRIYRGFASYLAERGFAVLTYDYRGVAGSRPKSLIGFPARMRDWAALDVTAALDHMRAGGRTCRLPSWVIPSADKPSDCCRTTT